MYIFLINQNKFKLHRNCIQQKHLPSYPTVSGYLSTFISKLGIKALACLTNRVIVGTKIVAGG